MAPAARHLRLTPTATAALLAAAALLLSAAVPAARAQEETENEEEFSYVPGAPDGPEHWGELNDEWGNCSQGRMQSPIDLVHDHLKLDPSLGYLNLSYRPAQASIVNRGHDIMVRFEGNAGSLTINGTTYYLRQLHWHTPAEHAVDGRRHDMELHLVHESLQEKAAVVGVQYEAGPLRDQFLQVLEPSIRRIAGRRNQSERIGVVDPRVAVRGGYDGGAYYRYMGSLTTPPCYEGVVWTVLKKVHDVTKYQLQLLRDAVDDGMENNARPLQELNNRPIRIFRPVDNNHKYK